MKVKNFIKNFINGSDVYIFPYYPYNVEFHNDADKYVLGVYVYDDGKINESSVEKCLKRMGKFRPFDEYKFREKYSYTIKDLLDLDVDRVSSRDENSVYLVVRGIDLVLKKQV